MAAIDLGELLDDRELFRARHRSIDDDCDDLKKIIITPVYRGRLAESYERTLNAWQGRPWYSVSYARAQRAASDFVERNENTIITAITYLTILLLLVTVALIAFRLISPVLVKSRGRQAGRSSDTRTNTSEDSGSA